MLRTRFLVMIAATSLIFVVGATLFVLGPRFEGRCENRPDRIVVTPFTAVIDLPEAPPMPQAAVAEVEQEPLSVTDQAVQVMAAELSAHPVLMEWLLTDRLVHRFAEAVEMVAGGMSPCEQLDFLRPTSPFLVQRREGRLVIAPGSYRRYDLAAEVFVSLDTEAAVSLLRRLDSVITEAHHEVAWYDGDFEDRLVQAMDHLLAVRVPEEPLAVRATVLNYAYADESFEQLSDAQRHLLRMGPRNAGRVQAKLGELRTALRPGSSTEATPLRVAAHRSVALPVGR